MPKDPFADGRAPNGRFVRGNRGGPGNPAAARVAKLRGALLDAVTLADVRAVAKKMVELALAGDVSAARLVFDRLLGPEVALDLLERLAKLEEALGGES